MENINLRFAKTLRTLRTEKGLTQEQLAEASGLDYKYLQKLEGKNPSSPTLETLNKLASGLNITLIDLVNELSDP
jgi:transcriptional regulator with XRE-family HTH domain